MNRYTLLIFILITVAVLGLLFVSKHYKDQAILTGTEARKGKNALQVLIDSTESKHPVVNDGLKGKIVVMNIWATWCKPCLEEIPELNKLVKDFKSDKVIFLAITEGDSAHDSKFMNREKIDFDYRLLFSQQELIDAISSLKLPNEDNAIPLNVVLNPEGKIEFYYEGNRPEQLEKIRNYLALATKTL